MNDSIFVNRLKSIYDVCYEYLQLKFECYIFLFVLSMFMSVTHLFICVQKTNACYAFLIYVSASFNVRDFSSTIMLIFHLRQKLRIAWLRKSNMVIVLNKTQLGSSQICKLLSKFLNSIWLFFFTQTPVLIVVRFLLIF